MVINLLQSKLSRCITYICIAIVMSCIPIFVVHAQGLDIDALRRALSGLDRDVSDFARDEARQPVEVLDFFGLQPGMTVLDIYAAGGYYTFILAKAVGAEGTVYAQNTPRGLLFKEDRQEITQGEALENKIRQGNLTNVTQIVRPVDAIGLPENSIDFIMLAQTLHDWYNPNPESALTLLLQLKALLKPGGVIGVEDHIGLPGRDNRDLHRMETQQAIALAEQAGFRVESSELLRSRGDDHSRPIFDPRLNRDTDRFLLRLVKP